MPSQNRKPIETVLGIDVGGSGVKGAPVNVITGEKLAPRFKIKTPEALTPHQMVDAFAELIDKFDWKGPIGVGFPTRLKNNVVKANSNLHKDWTGINLKDFFENHLKHEFAISNDADAAGIAEMEFGAGVDKKGTVILLTFGTGIGSAMFLDGKLIPGTEFGHLEYKKDRFEKYAADSARKREGLSYQEWGKRVNKYLQHVEMLFSPQLFIIGGGSSKKLDQFETEFTIETPYTAAQMLNVAGTVGAAMGYAKQAKLSLQNA